MQDILSISQELSRGLFVTISILIASSLFAYFMGFVSGLLRYLNIRLFEN